MAQDVSKLVFKQPLQFHRFVNKEKYICLKLRTKFSFWKFSLAEDSAGLCLLRPFLPVDCNWRTGENPIQMSGSVYVFPDMKLQGPRYLQNRIMMFCLPISTFMYLWAIYILPRFPCLFWCSLIGRSILGIYKSLTVWEPDRVVSFLGIHKSDFWYSVAQWSDMVIPHKSRLCWVAGEESYTWAALGLKSQCCWWSGAAPPASLTGADLDCFARPEREPVVLENLGKTGCFNSMLKAIKSMITSLT
jgi:hypothetical protein